MKKHEKKDPNVRVPLQGPKYSSELLNATRKETSAATGILEETSLKEQAIIGPWRTEEITSAPLEIESTIEDEETFKIEEKVIEIPSETTENVQFKKRLVQNKSLRK